MIRPVVSCVRTCVAPGPGKALGGLQPHPPGPGPSPPQLPTPPDPLEAVLCLQALREAAGDPGPCAAQGGPVQVRAGGERRAHGQKLCLVPCSMLSCAPEHRGLGSSQILEGRKPPRPHSRLGGHVSPPMEHCPSLSAPEELPPWAAGTGLLSVQGCRTGCCPGSCISCRAASGRVSTASASCQVEEQALGSPPVACRECQL